MNGWGSTALSQDTSWDNAWHVTISASTDNADSQFKFGRDDYWPDNWGAGSSADKNTSIGTLSSNGGNLHVAQVHGKQYTFRMDTSHSTYAVMETSNDPVTISAVSDNSPARYCQSVTVTISLSASTSAEETVYVVYTTDNWASRTLVAASGTGMSCTATIPPQSAGTTVSYYVITSTMPTETIAHNRAVCTLNFNNNNGANYAYTFAAKTTFYWRNEADDNKWEDNAAPPWQAGAPQTKPGHYGIIIVDNNNQAGNWEVNVNGLSIYQLCYHNNATTARTLIGHDLAFTKFYDFSTEGPVISNGSSATHVISVNLNGDATTPLNIFAIQGNLSFTATIDNNSQNLVATAAGDKNITISGAVVDAGGVEKNGAGTLTLSGANTYSGATTVNAGTLSGAGCFASDTTIKNGATLAPGASIGTLATKALTLENGSTVEWEYDDNTADAVAAAGTISLPSSGTPVTIKVKKTGSFVECTRTLFTFTGSEPSDAALSHLSFDLTDADGVTSVEPYVEDSSVVVILLPEPGMLGLALLALAALRRRRSG
jgi:autotransporter-associated beta strand protein